MTTAETLFASSAIHGGQELLLDAELEAGVDGQPQVLAELPGLHDLRPSSGSARPLASRWAMRMRGEPAQDVLVVLLDAVLAGVLAIDEAEQVRGERRSGPPPACG